MTFAVAALGAFVVVPCTLGFVTPERFRELVISLRMERLHLVAVGFRSLFGMLCIFAAPETRSPVAFQVLGWVMIAAAAGLLLIGRKRFESLVEWFVTIATSKSIVRLWMLIGMGAGSLIVYGSGVIL